MRVLATLASVALTAGTRCTWAPVSITSAGSAFWDESSYSIPGGAWDCSRTSPVGAPMLPAKTSISCLQGRQLHVVGDSISRTMLFDFVAALHKCDEQTAQHATVCDLASAARSKRGDYDVVLPWHLLDGSSTSSDASSDVRIAFRTVTVARNISAAPWFQSTFFDDAVDAGAAKADAVLFNVGLWNLRYDSPRSDVPGGYLRELQQLAEALSARSTALDGEAHRPRRLFWRATTPIEPAGNADFPSDYTPDLIRRANEGAWPIMREVAAALGAIDLTERTRVQPLADGASGQTSPGSVAGSGRSGPQLTVDGTHFEPWLNVIMMGDALAGICALEQRLLHAAPAPAGSAGSAAASDAAAFGGGGAGGLAPSFSAAAEGEASPAPSVSPATSAGGDTSSPSQTAGAAAAAVSVKPSSAAVVALTPAPAGVLPIVSVVGGLAAAAIAMYRTRLRTAARSNIGIAITLGFVWLLVSAIERWGLIPIIGKERAVGMDMLWAVFGLAVVVGRLTVTRSAPEQQRNPAAHADSAKSSAAGAAERREQTVVSSSADAAATSIAAAADENSRKPADADAAPSQQAPSAASDVASPSGSVSVAISIASAVEAAADSASGAGALRNREGAADGSVAAAEQEEASLLRDGSAEADSAATARKVESAAKGAMSPSSSAVPAGAGTDGNAAASTEAALVVASGGAGHASSSSPRTGAAAAGVPTFLSLDVCNELKGLCMVCFLLYHYWDVKTVYNPIRVMVAVFLFLTGYGNFLSLSASQKPPKLHKLCLSFIRINLLAAVLMTAVRAPWMLYYICPLHT